jgi:hypothetical protein
LIGKMNMNRKLPTEKEILQSLRKGEIEFSPLSFRVLEQLPSENNIQAFDAFIEATWEKNKVKFAVQCKSVSTPKAFHFTLYWLKVASLQKGIQPLLIVPFLNESQLKELEREKFNGIDLCGNGCISVPGSFSIFRNGQENRFTTSASIKNIYRKNSSMVGRSFLAQPSYKTVQETFINVNQRNLLVNQWGQTPMSLSTISKALNSLEEDLIIERNDKIRLLQPEKLLEKLSENYIPPYVKRKTLLKIPIKELISRINEPKLIIMATGASSVDQYATMETSEIFSAYTPDLEKIIALFPNSDSGRFPNLEIRETDDETAYFDARWGGMFSWASPVQTYLELMAGDKRDKETASQVKSFILNEIKTGQPIIT